MEKYLDETESIIGVFQHKMSDESFSRSAEAGNQIYEYITQVTKERELNGQELANAVMTINYAVLKYIMNEGEPDE